jgi:hypothetical protein
MTEPKTVRGLDFEALRRAYEGHDAGLATGLYADDAELRIVDRNSPPGAPLVLSGKGQISEYLHDVFSREMTHHIENEVIGEERVAMHIACRYPDESSVLCAVILEVRDGRIFREVDVQAWDD